MHLRDIYILKTHIIRKNKILVSDFILYGCREQLDIYIYIYIEIFLRTIGIGKICIFTQFFQKEISKGHHHPFHLHFHRLHLEELLRC